MVATVLILTSLILVMRGSRTGSSMQSSARGSASPTTEADYIGFRIAALELQVVPEPSSVGLLFIGAMGCVWRRKRS
mgnify:CR=1 FL=1